MSYRIDVIARSNAEPAIVECASAGEALNQVRQLVSEGAIVAYLGSPGDQSITVDDLRMLAMAAELIECD